MSKTPRERELAHLRKQGAYRLGKAEGLIEAAERLEREAAVACEARRNPTPYMLARTGEMFTPSPSCAGYYERGLRCPDCPEDDCGADVLREMADEVNV